MIAPPARSGAGRLSLLRRGRDGDHALKPEASGSEKEASGHVDPRFGAGSQEHGSGTPERGSVAEPGETGFHGDLRNERRMEPAAETCSEIACE